MYSILAATLTVITLFGEIYFVQAQNAVGIGTTTPSSAYMMHILGQGTKSGLLVESNTNRSGIQISQSGSEAGLRVFNASTSAAPGIRLDHQGNGDAFVISKTGSGGSVANFFNGNAANDASAVFSGTSAAGGYAIGASNFANGNAFAVWGGGMRVTTTTLSTGTTITSRNIAYLITGGGPYTISFPLSLGEIFYFFNSTPSAVSVAGITIPANAGRTCIVMDGILRGF